jgi:hypothetical protein
MRFNVGALEEEGEHVCGLNGAAARGLARHMHNV